MTRDDLETVVRIHQAELYRYLRYMGAENQSVAEDLVQDTFLAAFKSPDPIEPRGEKQQAAWLRGIARNLFLMHCRRARISPVRTDRVAMERAESMWTGEFLREGDGFDYIEALRKCLSTLGERQRKLLDLQYGQNKSRSEIAEAAEMSEDGIKSLMRRLRGTLGQCIRRRLGLEVEA